MTFSIHARNFQSIKDAYIEVEGLTALTGPNNAGKSAMARAFSGVFANARGTSFVRQGTSHSSVTVSFGNGQWVTWEKGSPQINRYLLDGLTLENVSHGPPEEVRALGVRSVKLGEREFWPQIAPQMSGPLFLVDAPGSVLAEAVADVNRVSVYNAALRSCETDRKSALTELKIRNKDLSQVRSRIGHFSGFQLVRDQFNAIESKHHQLGESYKKISLLEKLQTKLTQSQAEKNRLQNIQSVTQDIVFETIKNLKLVRTNYLTCQNMWTRWSALQQVKSSLQGITGIESPPSPELLGSVQQAFARASSLLVRLKGVKNDLVAQADRIKRLQEELSEIDKELLSCPTCGKPL